jgi:predicted XRE-type DNA-binding protein
MLSTGLHLASESTAASLRPNKTTSHALIKPRNNTKEAPDIAKRNDDDIAVHESAGNVFADLGLPDDREDMLKVEIAHAISAAIRKKGLTQTAAGEIIGVDQAKVSALLRGRLTGFSVDRLLVFLVKLGRDVDIMISRAHKNREGTVRVKSAA